MDNFLFDTGTNAFDGWLDFVAGFNTWCLTDGFHLTHPGSDNVNWRASKFLIKESCRTNRFEHQLKIYLLDIWLTRLPREVKLSKKLKKNQTLIYKTKKVFCTLASSAFISNKSYPSTQHVVHINHMDKSVDKTKERAGWGVKDELDECCSSHALFFPFKPWWWKSPIVRRWWKWGTGGKRQKRTARALEA